MCAREREIGVVMIELRRRPRNVAVTGQTIVAELISLVIGIRRAVELGCVTAKTVSGSAGITCLVTRGTQHRLVRTGQREIGSAVIEQGWRPDLVTVAGQAIMAKLVGRMIWIADGIVGRCMAAKAITRQSSELIVNMTGGTGERLMCTGQGKTTCLHMIEGGRLPGVFGMASFAFFRKAGGNMRRILRLRKVSAMANAAFAGKAAKLRGMAAIALQALMRAT